MEVFAVEVGEGEALFFLSEEVQVGFLSTVWRMRLWRAWESGARGTISRARS